MVEDIARHQHERAPLGSTGAGAVAPRPCAAFPEGPRDLVTTLWYVSRTTEDGEAQVLVPERSSYGYLPGEGRAEDSAAATAAGVSSVYHIVETPGEIDWRNEVEVPTEEYYQALRADLERRHPKASRFVLDHLILSLIHI